MNGVMLSVDACDVVSVSLQADPFLHMAQFSCLSIRCNCLWNCPNRKTSKQLHQLNAWDSKLCLRGKKQCLKKKLCIIYNPGEKPVRNFFRWAQNLEILCPEDGLIWMFPLHLRKRVLNDLMERGNWLAFYDESSSFAVSRRPVVQLLVQTLIPLNAISHRHFTAIHYM